MSVQQYTYRAIAHESSLHYLGLYGAHVPNWSPEITQFIAVAVTQHLQSHPELADPKYFENIALQQKLRLIEKLERFLEKEEDAERRRDRAREQAQHAQESSQNSEAEGGSSPMQSDQEAREEADRRMQQINRLWSQSLERLRKPMPSALKKAMTELFLKSLGKNLRSFKSDDALQERYMQAFQQAYNRALFSMVSQRLGAVLQAWERGDHALLNEVILERMQDDVQFKNDLMALGKYQPEMRASVESFLKEGLSESLKDYSTTQMQGFDLHFFMEARESLGMKFAPSPSMQEGFDIPVIVKNESQSLEGHQMAVDQEGQSPYALYSGKAAAAEHQEAEGLPFNRS